MSADLTVILEDCLERLAQGESIQACLAHYPDRAAELNPLLSAAARLEQAGQVQPSAAFKARTRTRLYAHMQAHPRGGANGATAGVMHISRPSRRLSPLAWSAAGLSTLLLAFTITGTALAQTALPGASLYPWKLASEQIWQSVAFDRPSVDLALAQRRLDEFLAVSGDSDAQGIALAGYRKIMGTLAEYKDPTDQARIQNTLKTQREKVRDSGKTVVLPDDLSAGSNSSAPQPLTGSKLPAKGPISATPNVPSPLQKP